jgi:hypothetical protein
MPTATKQQKLTPFLSRDGIAVKRRLLARAEKQILELEDTLNRLDSTHRKQLSELAQAHRQGKVGDVTMHTVPKSLDGIVGSFIKLHLGKFYQPTGVHIREQVRSLSERDPLS